MEKGLIYALILIWSVAVFLFILGVLELKRKAKERHT